MIAEAFDEKIYYSKIIPSWRPNKDLTLFIQYKKIFIKIGAIGSNYSGLMQTSSLKEVCMLQFKGMAVYDKDLYRLKQDEYKNWVLLNTSKLSEARSKVKDSAIIKEEDYIIKLLSPLEALAVNNILSKLNNT